MKLNENEEKKPMEQRTMLLLSFEFVRVDLETQDGDIFVEDYDDVEEYILALAMRNEYVFRMPFSTTFEAYIRSSWPLLKRGLRAGATRTVELTKPVRGQNGEFTLDTMKRVPRRVKEVETFS